MSTLCSRREIATATEIEIDQTRVSEGHRRREAE